MKEQIKLFLDWVIPIMCVINVILHWGTFEVAMAWIVATAGWLANLANRYKKYDNKNIY
jgi:hypothetical protein